MSIIKPSLDYLEENKLHPTRGARFVAARRLRLTNRYNVIGQIIATVALIIWSIVPLAMDVSSPKELAVFGVAASVALLAITLHQQAGAHIDLARSLEISARAIDRLRSDVLADIGAGKAYEPEAYRSRARQYADIIDENPVNHDGWDLKIFLAESRGFFYRVVAVSSLHLRSGAGFGFCLIGVLMPAIFFCQCFK